MPVIIKNRKEGLTQLLRGMDYFTNALKTTFGPRGNHVMISKSGEGPKMTRIGAEIADGFELTHVFQNLGVSLLRNVAGSTNSSAGDGAVMATLIARELVTETNKLVQAGYSIVNLRDGLKDACEAVCEELKKSAKPAKTRKQMKDLMATSSGGDTWMVEPIFNVQKKLGPRGVVSFSYTDGVETEIIFREGLSFDESLLSSHFEEPGSEFTELDDPFIFICADKITNVEELLGLSEKVSETDQPLLVIAGDVADDALSLLLLNKRSRVLNSAAVKAPGFGDERTHLLEDIAVYTGSTVFGNTSGRSLADIELKDLGRADKVRVERTRTIIVDGKGKKNLIRKRISDIKRQIGNEFTEFENQALEERIAKLTSGVCSIKIGGYTEHEKVFRRTQIARAYASLRSGVREGWVYGGGVGLLMAAEKLKGLRPSNSHQPAYKALAKALAAPLGVLAENSGVNGDYIKEKTIDASFKLAFNALSGKMEKLRDWHIIDPLPTVTSAVDSAVSLAVILLSSEIFITDKPYVVAPDEAPMLGLKGYKGMQGIPGMEHDHE